MASRHGVTRPIVRAHARWPYTLAWLYTCLFLTCLLAVAKEVI